MGITCGIKITQETIPHVLSKILFRPHPGKAGKKR